MAPQEREHPADGQQYPDQEARERRAEHQALWVDLEVRRAIERGEFDDLPGAGKPLRDVEDRDPDWWIKRLIERERISVLPPALALRVEDQRLHETLDATGSAERVRELLEDFNRRVVEARRQLQGGPPVVTALRDVDTELMAWRERRAIRARARATVQHPSPPSRRRWWRRRPRRSPRSPNPPLAG